MYILWFSIPLRFSVQHNTLNTVLVMLIFSKQFMSCMTSHIFYSKIMQWNVCIFSYKQKNSKGIREQPKYMVFEDLLMQLFQLCAECGHPTQGVINKEDGMLIEIMQNCRKCGCVKTWTSQPYTRRLPAGYILISCAILLSGALPYLTINLSLSPERLHSFSYDG